MQSEITNNSEDICFLCFSNYVTVFVENTRLQKVYEELLIDKMHSGSEPLCYVCYKRLLQWEQLVRQIQYIILKTDHHQGQETQLLKLSETHNYTEVPPEYSNKYEPDVKTSLKQCEGSAELKLDLSDEHYKDDHTSTNKFDHLPLDIKEEIITTDLEKCKETSDGIATGKQVSKEQKTDSSAFNRHLKTHSGEKAFSCDMCFKKFNVKSNLKRHINNCHSVKPTSNSNVRNKILSTKSDLVKHKKMNGNCNVCNKTFLSEYDLKRHIKIHTDKTYFTCDMCSKDFNNKYNLLTHIRHIHNRERPHKCDICGKGFYVMCLLKRHKVTHLSNAYNCDICRKKFPKVTDLKRHKEMHRTLLGSRDVQIVGQSHCYEICGKSYTTKGILMKHKKLHADEKPHNCEFCSNIFIKTSEYLKKHLKIHSDSKPL